REQTDQIARYCSESGTDQSPLVDSRRREKRRRNDDAVDDRRRYAEHPASPRFDKEGPPYWTRNPRRWLPGEGRNKPRQWPRSNLPRRKEDFLGCLWSGGPAAGRGQAVSPNEK